ncbi:hypothetical protein EDC01DRAFT_287233 [Geopyxis carbonaria]|nr:hypothetical protein EDC01DRAFT_287233 [Geopyxis carbonaria]
MYTCPCTRLHRFRRPPTHPSVPVAWLRSSPTRRPRACTFPKPRGTPFVPAPWFGSISESTNSAMSVISNTTRAPLGSVPRRRKRTLAHGRGVGVRRADGAKLSQRAGGWCGWAGWLVVWWLRPWGWRGSGDALRWICASPRESTALWLAALARPPRGGVYCARHAVRPTCQLTVTRASAVAMSSPVHLAMTTCELAVACWLVSRVHVAWIQSFLTGVGWEGVPVRFGKPGR